MLSSLLTVLILAGIFYWVYKLLFKKVKYRIKLIDPVTGQIKFLTGVDGINNHFTYESVDTGKLYFDKLSDAERYLYATDPQNGVIEYKKGISPWKEVNSNLG